MTPPTPPPAAGIQDAARHLAEARIDEAVTVLERLVTDFPAYVTAHVLLAKACEASGRMDDALEAWHRAYFLMPGSPLIIRERTRLLRSASSLTLPSDASDTEAPDASADVAASEADAGGDPFAPKPVQEAEVITVVEKKPSNMLDEVDDLDTLIHQIENAPRIRPDPSFKEDPSEEEEDDDEELVSETLARIYEAQKQYDAAAHAYEQLADQRPERATELLSKAAELRRLAASGGD